MAESYKEIFFQLKKYKSKFYTNSLIRGIILFLASNSFFYVFISSLEYYFRFTNAIRAFLLFAFVILILVSLFLFIIKPLWLLINKSKGMSDEEAARQIGVFFPEISDKLLNSIQLINSQENTELLAASIEQRTSELKWFHFAKAIDFTENRRFVKFLVVPLMLIVSIVTLIPELFSESNERIINYNKEFIEPAPFDIEIQNESLRAFRNDDFELGLKFSGDLIPENAFIKTKGRRVRLKKNTKSDFSHTWRKLQDDESFQIEASGFLSQVYNLRVIPKPELENFEISIKFPSYTRKAPEKLSNIGDFSVPVGSKVTWNLNTSDCDSLSLILDDQQNQNTITKTPNKDFWTHSLQIQKPIDYQVSLKGVENSKRDFLKFHINSIPDQFPQIRHNQVYDTALFEYIIIGGSISDDYGFSNFKLQYELLDNDITLKKGSIPLSLTADLRKQNYNLNWNLDSFDVKAGLELKYFIEVFDNDGYNGPKRTTSNTYNIRIPDISEIRKEVNAKSKSMQNQLSNLQKEAQQLNEELNNLMDETKSKKNLEWKDKNKIDQVLKKHESLKEQLEELNKELQRNIETKQKFEKQNESIKEKTESLKDLMNQILDEDTKELLKELQKLLEENGNKNQMQNKLDELESKDFDIEKELDRALELFKQLQFEERLEQSLQDLEELSKKQDALSEKTEDKSLDNKELSEEQEKLNEKFDDIKQELEELQELDESMEVPNEFNNDESLQEEIDESMEKSLDDIQKGKNKKSSEQQKNSSQKMKELSKEMSDFMMSMESQNMMEDINNLRQILENLVTLSFDQEALMNEFKTVNQSDPRYVDLGQQQLKLKDDAKIVQDSLYALAKRVFQIQSFVTREVGKMNENIEEALEAIKDRKNPIAAGKQQFAMTSINNLALMLNQVLSQMQEQMAQQMSGDQMCNKPKKNGKPSMSKMQEQLNQQIRELKQSGKQGRQLSEELAKLSQQQEALRKMLEELENGEGQLDQSNQNKLSDLKKIMEESEKDLVHKNLTQELLERQEEILTRLLESEKAQRQQKTDPKREATSSSNKEKQTPPDLEKYLKEKERQLELVKTISPNLNPYYQDRVNKYFEKIYE